MTWEGSFLDKDKSGYITKQELLEVLKARGIQTVTLEQIDELLKEIDKDRSGEIDYEEFVLLMTK